MKNQENNFPENKIILDPCCGSKMLWFDKSCPNTVFGDRRSETLTVTDRSNGKINGTRTIHIKPDLILDFRSLPFPDNYFRLVIFDPPHLLHAGKTSWLACKYGFLGANWHDDLRRGFSECFRVLTDEGVLIFKWNETQIKLKEILALTEYKPLFGNTSGKRLTHWMVFIKSGGNFVNNHIGKGIKQMEHNLGNLVKLLALSYDEWTSVYENGTPDPLHSDGVNLNLIRNHIDYYKQVIEEKFPREMLPEIVSRETPPEVSTSYMAKADEIRQLARKALAKYLDDKNYRYLEKIYEFLPTESKDESCIQNVLGYCKKLQEAIKTDDLVYMRVHRNYEIFLSSFNDCAETIKKLNLICLNQVQLKLF